jgi:hypothetical protein
MSSAAARRMDRLKRLPTRWRGWFNPGSRHESAEHQRIWAMYEIAFTVADVSAALMFVVGSWLFFYEPLHEVATWLFLIGSVCFALKPTLRLAREIHYWRMGHTDELAERSGR